MKNKKLFLPAIVLVAAILTTAAYSIVVSIAKKPTITEAEFPFKITYELDGKQVTINDVYKVRYTGNDGYSDTKTRIYVGEISDLGEGNTVYNLKKDGNTRIELWTHFYPDYLMGDSEYDYFDGEAFEPKIYYYDSEETEYCDEQTLSEQGVKLISYEYPTPIENSLVFSHISYFNSEIVFPNLLIALIALLVIAIFVKKEKDYKYTSIDTASFILNCIVGSVYLIFVTVVALVIDIEGGGPELYYQMLYFIPSFSTLCLAASVALRRRKYSKSSLVVGLVGPAFFIVYLIVCAVCGLL